MNPITISPEWLYVLGGILVGVLGWIRSVPREGLFIKRNEIGLLRSEVQRLHARLDDDEKDIRALKRTNLLLSRDLGKMREHATRLRMVLIERGVANIPPMPHLESDSELMRDGILSREQSDDADRLANNDEPEVQDSKP